MVNSSLCRGDWKCQKKLLAQGKEAYKNNDYKAAALYEKSNGRRECTCNEFPGRYVYVGARCQERCVGKFLLSGTNILGKGADV